MSTDRPSPAVDTADFRASLERIVRAVDLVYTAGRYLIIGAFARDVHVHLRAGRPLPRATADIDICIAVPDDDTFGRELGRLERGGTLRTRRRLPPAADASLPFEASLPVDVLPFGDIAPDGIFEDDHIEYDIRGLEDAYRHAEILDAGGGTLVRVPSLAALIGLKVIAWAIRRKTTDAKDLAVLFDVCGDAPYSEEVWEPSAGAGQYDFELALEGPHLQGERLAATFGRRARERVLEVIGPHGELLDLLVAMTPPRGVGAPTRADQYEALRQGIVQGSRP